MSTDDYVSIEVFVDEPVKPDPKEWEREETELGWNYGPAGGIEYTDDAELCSS